MRWLVGQVVDEVSRRRQYELWEAGGDGRPYFMVAGNLTKKEAVATAAERTKLWPRLRVMVLDGAGANVYR